MLPSAASSVEAMGRTPSPTYVYGADGDKIRTIQFRGAGTLTPTSLFFGTRGQLLVTPGLYEFDAETR